MKSETSRTKVRSQKSSAKNCSANRFTHTVIIRSCWLKLIAYISRLQANEQMPSSLSKKFRSYRENFELFLGVVKLLAISGKILKFLAFKL